jgi:nucleoid-associated protein YgaU
MDRGLKVVVASGVLLGGVAMAMLFRHPSQASRPPKSEVSESLVLRQGGEPDAPELPAERLTTRIEPPVEVERRSAPEPDEPESLPLTNPPPPMPSRRPPVPPVLARSYPPFGDMAPSASSPGERTPSNWDPPTPPGDPDADRRFQPPRRHTIVDGDTLADLAERYLGDAARWLEIYEANRDRLPSPEVLPIGVEIIIPPRQRPQPPAAPVIPEQPLVPVAPAS